MCSDRDLLPLPLEAATNGRLGEYCFAEMLLMSCPRVRSPNPGERALY
jgi:hypothetical protein